MGISTRIAHLSDCHLNPVPFPRPWRERARLKQILGFINWWRQRHETSLAQLDATIKALSAALPEAIALTGDIIELGQMAEAVTARNLLEDISAIAPLLVTLGNHDPYTPEAVPRLARAWKEYLPPIKAPADDLRASYPLVRTVGPATVMILCSAKPTWLFSAEGDLGQDQIERLEAALAELPRAQTLPVIALHHPPDPAGLSILQRLRDGPALLDVLARHQVPLLLHGHTHRGLFRSLSWKGHHFIAAGAPCACASAQDGLAAAGFNLIEITRQDQRFHLKLFAERMRDGRFFTCTHREFSV